MPLLFTAAASAAAANAVGLSYKGPWDTAQALNNLFQKLLIVTRASGDKGGFAEVTEEGSPRSSLWLP